MSQTSQQMSLTEYNMKKIGDYDTMPVIGLLFDPASHNGVDLTRKHQILSFDQFLLKYLPKIIQTRTVFDSYIKEENNIHNYSKLTHTIEISNVQYSKPRGKTMSGGDRILFPINARRNDLDYKIDIYVDAYYKLEAFDAEGRVVETIEKRVDHFTYFRLPILVGCCKCSLYGFTREQYLQVNEDPYDLGGYFILKGSEKVIISLERLAQNMPLYTELYNRDKGDYNYLCTVKSRIDDEFNITYTLKIFFNQGDKYILVNIPSTRVKKRNYIPFIVIMKALGIETDREIISYYLGRDFTSLEDLSEVEKAGINLISNSLNPEVTNFDYHTTLIITKLDALDFLVPYVIKVHEQEALNFDRTKLRLKVQDYINQNILPHLGTESYDTKKAFYICRVMLRKLINGFYKTNEFQWDPNSFIIKRVDTAGILMAQLFKQLFDQNINSMKKSLTQDTSSGNMEQIRQILDIRFVSVLINTKIATTFDSAIRKGNWHVAKFHGQRRTGVTQTLERESYLRACSHISRINTSISSTQGKSSNISIHNLHATHLGIICDFETPEGQKIGVAKNKATSAEITIGFEKSDLLIALEPLKEERLWIPFEELNLLESSQYRPIFANGDLIGFTDRVSEFWKKCIELRRSGIVPYEFGVVYDHMRDEMRLSCDNGRMIRPLLIVDPKNRLRLNSEIIGKIVTREITWQQLIAGPYCCIEYVDVEETALNCLLAQYPSEVYNTNYEDKQFTHCEIHPTLVVGIAAGTIPYLEHLYGVRGLFASALNKHAISFSSMNMAYRTDAIAHMLQYGQIPISLTCLREMTNMIKYPTGQNCFVLIGCYTGYNQEDSLVVNQGSIERGMLNTFMYKTVSLEIDDGQRQLVIYPDFEKVDNLSPQYYYRKIDQETGIIRLGSVVEERDILICLLESERYTERKRDISIVYTEKYSSVVDDIIQGINESGRRFIKIKLRTFRQPRIGDKLAITGAQKSTISLTLPQWYMPFTEDGISPDIIINPNAFPGRMSIGVIFEMISNLIGTKLQVYIDATAYNRTNIETINRNLVQLGFEDGGKQTFYNGFTGSKIKTKLFAAPCYYQRLKHMVEDKIHARSIGSIVGLTRQPVSGRAKGGGLKIGGMEINAIIAHGASMVLNDKLMRCSDAFDCYVCDNCGLLADFNNETGLYHCRTCPESYIKPIRIPYTFKLFQQYLMGVGIGVRLFT